MDPNPSFIFSSFCCHKICNLSIYHLHIPSCALASYHPLLTTLMIGQRQQDTFKRYDDFIKVQPMVEDLQNLVDKIWWTRPKGPDLSYYRSL